MESKRQKAIAQALQLKPDEKAIVIIKGRSVETFNISTLDLIEMLASTLAKIMSARSIQGNISEEEKLSFLQLLLNFIKDEYENYSKATTLKH